ncbi:hypothetical protein VTL71DRAFT_11480 [Oculimacula yallundae]|uniref:Uncharacterized protein n=1 Tax=Oculimacula yallundae TaxID=86028 RepID=A0ABR4CRD7_9HELO
MHRSDSRTKWMDVLGFDQPVQIRGHRHSPGNSITSSSDGQESAYGYVDYPLHSPTYAAYPRLPREITFLRSRGDILLSPSSPAPLPNDIKPLPAPPHLFYISIQKDARADLLVHSGPSKVSTVIAFAKFYSVTQITDITLRPTLPRSASINFSFPYSSQETLKQRAYPKSKFEQLAPTNGLFGVEKYEFCYTLPWNDVRERFEWRHTSGPFMRSIDRDSGGLKLIRVSTGNVIAVYAGLGQESKARNPGRVQGMFRFLKEEGTVGLGEEFEVLAIVSILSLVERARRGAMGHKRAFSLN